MVRIANLALAVSLLAAASLAHATELSTQLRTEILKRPAGSFEPLLHRWEKTFGSRAVSPLLGIAADTKALGDPERYVALMGAAKLGGSAVLPALTPFLKDRSWMMRSGTLRAFRALGDSSTGRQALPLLKDPALVVRSEAVDTVSKLNPPGAVDALVSATEQPSNYHRGKAQWVPHQALSALVELKAVDAAPRLRPLLKHSQDPALQKKAIETLEALTGKQLKKGATLPERVAAWDQALAR